MITPQRRDKLRAIGERALKRITGQALQEPGATGRLLVALYPNGVPANQVADLPEVVGIARGLGQLCDGGPINAAPWRDIAASALIAQANRDERDNETIGLVPVKEGDK